MAQSIYEKALSDSFIGVMEGMAFLFASPTPKNEMELPADDFFQTEIEFMGQFQGRLKMAAPKNLCTELAANMLGIEPQDADAQHKSGDALKETLNIVCGKFLTAAFGKALVFNLTTPSLKAVSSLQVNTMKDDAETICFMIDQSPALLNYQLVGCA